MQPPRMHHPVPEAGAHRQDSRKRAGSEPLDELENRLIQDLRAAAEKVHLEAGKGAGRPQLRRAVRECRGRLLRLCGLHPGVEPWRLERSVLPDGLKHLNLSLYGLPKAKIPFSPSNSWKNEGLALAMRSSLERGEGAFCQSILAMVLDRFVQCSFPLDQIPDFYRPAVARLSSSARLGPDSYHADVIANARFLAGRVLPYFLARNANLLNTLQHNYIHTKTGDPLTEPDPDQKISLLRLKQKDAPRRRRKAGSSALSELGLSFDSKEVADSISEKLGLPAIEQVIDDGKPALSEKSELESSLNFNIRQGSETTYSHPDLQGLEFTPDEVRAAVSFVAGAEKILVSSENPEEAAASGSDTAIIMLVQMPHFRKAFESGLRSEEMRSALAVCAVERRARQLMDEGQAEAEEAYAQASEDFKLASHLVIEFRMEKAAPSPDQQLVRDSVRRMIVISSMNPEIPHYDIAIEAINEKRAKRQSLTTIRPHAMIAPPAQAPEQADEDTEPRMPVIGAPPVPAFEEAHEEPKAEIDVSAAKEPEAVKEPEKIELVFTLINRPYDPGLEQFLPAKTDKRTAVIRHVSRILSGYLVYGTPDESIPQVYQPVLRSLRGEKTVRTLQTPILSDEGIVESVKETTHEGYLYSHAALVEAAAALVDRVSPDPGTPPEARESARPEIQQPEEAPQAAAPAQAITLVFPYGNPATDPELEKVLPARVDERTALIRQTARNLRMLASFGEEGTIPDVYIRSVAALKEGFSYGEVVRQAERLVDLASTPPTGIAQTDRPGKEAPAGHPRFQPEGFRPEEAATRPMAAPYAAALSKLNDEERDLISAVMRSGTCDEPVLREFMQMHPGRRELLIRQLIASRWNESGDMWRTEIQKFRAAHQAIYTRLAMSPPTPAERFEAICDVSSLSRLQQHFVAQLFDIRPEHITAIHVRAFAAWVSGDRMSLDSAWKAIYPDPFVLLNLAQKMVIPGTRFTTEDLRMISGVSGIPVEKLTSRDVRNVPMMTAAAKALEAKKAAWFGTTKEERMRFWRNDVHDLLALGDLVHKIRFRQGDALYSEEADLLSAASGGLRDVKRMDDLDEQERSDLMTALTNHTYTQKVGDHKTTFYHQQILSLAAFGIAMNTGSLLISARKEEEFGMMLDFFGLGSAKAWGRLDLQNGSSRQKFEEEKVVVNGRKATVVKDTYTPGNDDTFSSARVIVPDGSEIIIDAVFDGMGGHTLGAKRDRTNGEVASGIAKDVFDICALAGWMTTPEEARRTVLLADLAIVMEAISMKGNRDQYQENNLGSTMAIGFQRGKEFYSIHCGDSSVKVFRNGALAYQSEGHSGDFDVRNSRRPVAQQEIYQEWAASGSDPQALFKADPRWIAEFNRQVETRITDSLEAIYADNPQYRPTKNMVSSVVGVCSKYVHINNMESGYAPIMLDEKDLIELNSDGIDVPICDHELPMFIAWNGGDLQRARAAIINECDSRKNYQPYQPHCACEPRMSKNDDKTMILREAGEGFPYAAVKKKLHEDPRGFSTGPHSGLNPLLSRAASRDSGMDEVEQLLSFFIDAAETAPRKTASDVYTVAIASIFHVAATRPEREQILGSLIPRIGSWSGLIIKKLKNSPNASPAKACMFHVVSHSVSHEDLIPLLHARNPEISAMAAKAIGIEEEPQEKVQPPRSIFNSQTHADGSPLGPYETRYLDSVLIDLAESTVVQDTAAKLMILPRDLEIMVFYVYSDFNPELSVDPHLNPGIGQNMAAEISYHLCCDDAERILLSSYLIYCLKETKMDPAAAGKAASDLWEAVKGMDQKSASIQKFYYEALRLRKVAGEPAQP
ncbi:MAG: hypothetical protein U0R44_05950 [Candidatus Micrarchaeia archaeon]